MAWDAKKFSELVSSKPKQMKIGLFISQFISRFVDQELDSKEIFHMPSLCINSNLYQYTINNLMFNVWLGSWMNIIKLKWKIIEKNSVLLH